LLEKALNREFWQELSDRPSQHIRHLERDREREVQSRLSVWSRTCDISIFLFNYYSFGELHFAENPTWIRPVVTKLWATERLAIIWILLLPTSDRLW